MIKNKLKIIIILIISFISFVFVIGETNGEYIITEEEFYGITDEFIANFILNQFNINSYQFDYNNLYVYYNVTVIEPTHINNTYRIYNIQYQTVLNYDHVEMCLSQNTTYECYYILVENNIPVVYETIDEFGELQNIVVEPTQYQALQRVIESYESAIELRDNIIQQNLWEEFINP